jgi:hypothetical protein
LTGDTEIGGAIRAGTIGALTDPALAGAVGASFVDGVQSPDLGLITNLTGNLIQGKVISNRIVRERLGLSGRPRLPAGTPNIVRQAGRAAGAAGRVAGPLTAPFEFGSEYGEQREDGRTGTEAAVVAGTKTAGSLTGGAAGGAACAATGYFAPATCPLLVPGGAAVGGVLGELGGEVVAEPAADVIDFLIPGSFSAPGLGPFATPLDPGDGGIATARERPKA